MATSIDPLNAVTPCLINTKRGRAMPTLFSSQNVEQLHAVDFALVAPDDD